MKFQIKKRFSNEVLIEGEAESFVKFVEVNKSNLSYSDLSYSDLSDSNLSYSDLSDSDLSGSNLSYSDLSDSKIKATQKEEIIKALKIEVRE